MPPADPHAADVDAIYLDKMRSLKPKYGYGGPVMRADPGIAHLDAAIASIAAKQNDILASNYRNSAELSELRAVVETLARSIAETNERVFNLRDQVLHPLTGALAEHGEKMTREFQHRSAVAVVHETAQIALPEIIDAVERRHEEQTAAREEMHREVLDALGGVEETVRELIDAQGRGVGDADANSNWKRALGASLSMKRRLSASLSQRSSSSRSLATMDGGDGRDTPGGASTPGGDETKMTKKGMEAWPPRRWGEWTRDHVEVFRALSTADVASLFDAGHAECYVVDPGVAVISQGERCGSIFVVASGELEASTTTPDGERVALGTLRVGEVFGEMAAHSDDGARCATVRAMPNMIAKLPGAEKEEEGNEGDDGRCLVVEIRQAGLVPLMFEREALGAALEKLAVSRTKANAALAKRLKHVKEKAKKKSGWW